MIDLTYRRGRTRLKLTQLVDQRLIESLQKRLTRQLRMSIVFEEPRDGELIPIGSRGEVCKSCTEFIDLLGKGRDHCIKFDTENALRARGKALAPGAEERINVEFYVCNGRMRNFVIPILVGGEVPGCVYAGQFLVDEKKDTNLTNAVNEMTQFGYHPKMIHEYATPPTERDIPAIAQENNISDEDYPQFEECYKSNLHPSMPKSLQDVVNAVYLLHDIAQTISVLGNGYYLKNLPLQVSTIVPGALAIDYGSQLAQLHSLAASFDVRNTRSISGTVREMNQLAHELLMAVMEYEGEYIENLLSPYMMHGLEASEPLVSIMQDFHLGKLKEQLGRLDVLLNGAREDLQAPSELVILNKHEEAYKALDTKLTDLLKGESGSAVSEEVLEEMSRAIASELDDLQREAGGTVKRYANNPTIDHVQHLVLSLTEERFGFRPLRDRLIETRALGGLDSHARKIREQLRLRYDTIYMNYGGISPSRSNVLLVQEKWEFDRDERGPVSLWTDQELGLNDQGDGLMEEARRSIATLVNSQPNEIVFTANTTHGIELALQAVLHPPEGITPSRQNVILTSLEHDTVRYACKVAARRCPLELRYVEIGTPPLAEKVAQSIIEKLDATTAAVLLSHVTYGAGFLLDIATISERVREGATMRGFTAPVFIVDGAQAVGQIPVNVETLGCDFYAADGHKWLMGPVGSGFLFVREEVLRNNAKHMAFYKNLMVSDEFRPKTHTGRLLESATMNLSTLVGLEKAVETMLPSPLCDSLFETIRTNANLFFRTAQESLQNLGALLTHQDAGGIVIFRLRSIDDVGFYETVRKELEVEHRVVCRVVSGPPGLRFCLHFTVGEEEIKIAVHSLKQVLEKHISDVEPAQEALRRETETEKEAQETERLREKKLADLEEQVEVCHLAIEEIFKTSFKKARRNRQMKKEALAYKKQAEEAVHEARDRIESRITSASTVTELENIEILLDYPEHLDTD